MEFLPPHFLQAQSIDQFGAQSLGVVALLHGPLGGAPIGSRSDDSGDRHGDGEDHRQGGEPLDSCGNRGEPQPAQRHHHLRDDDEFATPLYGSRCRFDFGLEALDRLLVTGFHVAKLPERAAPGLEHDRGENRRRCYKSVTLRLHVPARRTILESGDMVGARGPVATALKELSLSLGRNLELDRNGTLALEFEGGETCTIEAPDWENLVYFFAHVMPVDSRSAKPCWNGRWSPMSNRSTFREPSSLSTVPRTACSSATELTRTVSTPSV